MKRLLIICLLSMAVLSSNAQLNKRYFVRTGFEMLGEERYGDAVQTLSLLLSIDDTLHEAYYIRGIAKFRLGDMPGAESDLSRAIELSPVFTYAYYQRALLRANKKDFAGAVSDLSKMLELRPDITEAYFDRAIALLNEGEYERSVEDMGRYIRLNGGDDEAYVMRGEAYLRIQDTVRAKADIDAAIEINRNSPKAYYRRGILEASQGRWGEALRNLTSAVENDPDYLPALFGRATVYHEVGRQKEALQDLDRVIALDNGYTAAYFNRAVILSKEGRLKEALADYDAVAASNPNNVMVYYNRAGAHTLLGDYRAAEADYSRAIELYHDFANAYTMRSEVRALMGDARGSKADIDIARKKVGEYRSAVADSTYSVYADPDRDFSRLVAFDTPFARGVYDRQLNVGMLLKPMYRYMPVFGIMVLSVGENTMSLEELKSVEGSDFELGVVQMLGGQYADAVNLFSSAIEKDRFDGKFYLARAVARAEMIKFVSSIGPSHGPSRRTYNYDEAFADIHQAIRLMPGEARVVYNCGNLNFAAGRMPEAVEDYTRALALDSSLAEAWFNRGLVQIHLKETNKGLVDLGKAGELGLTEAYEIIKTYNNYD